MKPVQIRRLRSHVVASVVALMSVAVPVAAEDDADRLGEIEKQVQILTEELERLRLGEVAEPAKEPKYGLGPAASKVYRLAKPGVSIAGYGEALYQNVSDSNENDDPSGRLDEIDFVRAVLYSGFKFSDWIIFNSELEFEHASTGKRGEVSVEFAYLDLLLSDPVNVRAGMLLVPVGIVNERHEPSTFHGSRRTEIEQVIIPSTWRANGAGVFGEIVSGVAYRLYLVEGLNAAGFTAGGIRGGRQSGSRAVAEDFGVSGRIEYDGLLGAKFGGSFYAGNSGQAASDSLGGVSAMTSVVSVHGDYARRGLEMRALYAMATVDDAGRLNALLDLTGMRSIGEEMSGWYATAAYDVLPLLVRGTRQGLSPFVQYQSLNTQEAVPSGFDPDPANERTVLTVGLTYKPDPNVAIKFDHQSMKNEAETGVDQWNLAINYLF